MGFSYVSNSTCHYECLFRVSSIQLVYFRFVWLFNKTYLRFKNWTLLKITSYPSSSCKVLNSPHKVNSLPKPLGFKCNPLLFSSFEVIFPLSMISICKPCKCSFVLITVKEALPLSVRVIKLEMTKILSSKVFLINFHRSSYLKSLQNEMVYFNYFLRYKVNRYLNKALTQWCVCNKAHQ